LGEGSPFPCHGDEIMFSATKRFVVSQAKALMVLAALAIAAAPVFAAQECTIKCEKCTCNLNTGQCECTNCTITGCTPK
jgi:hypothetical protein